MNSMTVSDFRGHMAKTFDRVDAGEQIIIRRNKKMYTVVPLQEEGLVITPELQKRIDEARKAFAEGKCIECRTPEELEKLFDSL